MKFNKYNLKRKYKRAIRNIKNFYTWSIIGKNPIRSIRTRTSYAIKGYFDGHNTYEVDDLPVEKNLSTATLGITNLRYRQFKNHLLIEITLQRPGLLIGKGGRTIDKFTEYLTDVLDTKITLSIVESRLWGYN